MKLLLSLVTTLFLVIFTFSVMAKSIVGLPEYSKIYDDQRSPFQDATAALALAKATNRQVLIEVGGNWCSWCHKMDAFLTNNPEVYQTLHANYVLLKINVSDSNENADFMAALPPVLGYPHMYVSSATGKMLLSKDTAELLSGSDYSKEHWLTFLNKWSLEKTSNKINSKNDNKLTNGKNTQQPISDRITVTQQDTGE